MNDTISREISMVTSRFLREKSVFETNRLHVTMRAYFGKLTQDVIASNKNSNIR